MSPGAWVAPFSVYISDNQAGNTVCFLWSRRKQSIGYPVNIGQLHSAGFGEFSLLLPNIKASQCVSRFLLLRRAHQREWRTMAA